MLALILSLAAVQVRDTTLLRPRPAAEVGMAPERLAVIDRAVRGGVAAGGFPGAAVLVGRNGAIVWEKGYGATDWGFGLPTVDPASTIYDVASLTKVVATTAAAMVLYDRGRLRLETPVGRYLPEFRRGEKARVTIGDLLTHRSGLPVGRDLTAAVQATRRSRPSRPARNPRQARRVVIETPLTGTPGEYVSYSDLGPDVLGFVIEAITGERLDRFVARAVYQPLGLRNTLFLPPPSRRSKIAPTEIAPPRGYPLRGEVHDENAWALGGVAGHAGLFSTARDLAVFAQMMLNGGTYRGRRIVRDSTVARFTARTAGSRALGWDTCSGGGSCGFHLSRRAYGHTGYTGTSMWIDPEQRLFVIVLTNWVHGAPGRPVAPIAVLADVRSDVADIAALSILDGPGGERPMPERLRSDWQIGWRRQVYGTRE